MERLPWVKTAENEYIAHPEGDETKPLVRVWLDINRPAESQWRWTVDYPGWFSSSGHAGNPKEASGDATNSWYTLKQTPVPRDIEADLAAAVLSIEAGSLPDLSDDSEFLRRLINVLRIKHLPGQNPPPPPEPIRKAFAALSDEMFRRRTGR
jgi:hypothetical protein